MVSVIKSSTVYALSGGRGEKGGRESEEKGRKRERRGYKIFMLS